MPKRDDQHMQAQQERILRATIACIAQKGAERTTIADIARQASLSIGAIYVHFDNKQEIVAAALRYGSLMQRDLPEDWDAIVGALSSLDDQLGFSIETIVRCRLHLHAESVHPGDLHDTLKPLLIESLEHFAARLEQLDAQGVITMPMPAWQTAISMAAYIEGMLLLNLSIDRPLSQLQPELAAGLRTLAHKAS